MVEGGVILGVIGHGGGAKEGGEGRRGEGGVLT